jgi:integrase
MNGFSSPLAQQMENFIGYKRSVGYYHGATAIYNLKSFDRYCCAHSASSMTKEVVEGWVVAEADRLGDTNSLSFMSVIREFGRYLRASGDSGAYVLSDRFRRRSLRPPPYLLSGGEVSAFFAACGRVGGRHGAQRRLTLTAVFQTMHALGLRTCEVCKLRRRDVDLGAATMDIIDSKGPKSRRMFFTDELAAFLADYDAFIDCMHPAREAFFASLRGGFISGDAIARGFRAVWDEAGLARPAHGPQPRPYSFRHHFAFANIVRWQKEGLRADTMMPYLSRAMGHSSLGATYYYIDVSFDMLSGLAAMTEQLEALLPEVGADE